MSASLIEAIKYSGSFIQYVGLLYVEKHWYFGFWHGGHIFPCQKFSAIVSMLIFNDIF
jgi:hypothetical protein